MFAGKTGEKARTEKFQSSRGLQQKAKGTRDTRMPGTGIRKDLKRSIVKYPFLAEEKRLADGRGSSVKWAPTIGKPTQKTTLVQGLA